MSNQGLYIALRGQLGLWVDYGPPDVGKQAHIHRYPGINCQCMGFSTNGDLVAYSDGDKVVILQTSTFDEVCTINQPHVTAVIFSPQASFIACWGTFRGAPQGQRPDENMNIFLVANGRLVKGFIQKKLSGWQPQWSQDEVICARSVNNEVHFYEGSNFNRVAQKLCLQNIQDFKLPPKCAPPYYVAAYVPCTKGQPAFARIFQYPNFANSQSALAQKSFYKADRVELIWSPPGKALLILAASEVSADSYYGEQGLHYIDVKGEACLVPRSKNGPVYSCVWAPDGKQFCVVYGYMPAKASLFNLKCEPIFDFGTGPRNIAHYNPFGNILCLAGFGNLQGNLEFWDLTSRQLIKQTQARDTTYFEWAPDGEHVITATLAPRLRVNNGYKLWHYTGDLLYEVECDLEVWEAHWQPCHEGSFQAPVVQAPKGGTVQALGGAEGAKKYVPPAMRNRSEAEQQKSKFREAYEPPSNAKEKKEEPMSKSAQKNKKRREAKKAAASGGGDNPPQAANQRSPDQAAALAAAAAIHAPASQQGVGEMDPEVDKKVKNLRKKLKQIEKLKEREAAGEKLELNQKEKIESEASLLDELEQLTLR